MLQERVQQWVEKTRAESEEVENVRQLLGNDRVLSELHLEERDVPGEPADDEDAEHGGEDDERALVGSDRATANSACFRMFFTCRRMTMNIRVKQKSMTNSGTVKQRRRPVIW